MADPRHRPGRPRRSFLRWGTGALAVLAALSLTVVSAPAAQAAPGPSEAPEWWFDTWHVTDLWTSGADGTGITVAIVDTGVQASIPELAGKVVAGADFIGNGTDGRVDFDSEDFSHGTAMASIVAARKGYGNIEGLAPGAKILPIAVPLQGVIRQGTPRPNATASAVRYAADHGAKIISMSLGGKMYEGEDDVPCPTELQDSVLYAVSKGALVVAASGNSGDDGSPVEEPGVCLGVISVGAVDRQSRVTSFSSRHPYLTVSAPGDEIATLSKFAERAFIGGGTSQATAMTSAALALIWSKYPSETNSEIASRLIGTAQDEGPKGRDPAYGYGVIDPYDAIRSSTAASKPNSVFTGVAPLLAQQHAIPKKPAVIKAAGSADAPIGSLEVGPGPSTLDPAVFAYGGVGAALLLLAVVLFVVGLRRTSPAPAPYPGTPYPNPPYPNPPYPNPPYPNPQYPNTQYPTPQYPTPQYPTPPYPTPPYPNPQDDLGAGSS